MSTQRKTGIPYKESELFCFGPQRTFEEKALSQIAFPLGGIGTGTISMRGRGQLRDWEIFNRPGKGLNLPFSFFAIRTKEKGKDPTRDKLDGRARTPRASKCERCRDGQGRLWDNSEARSLDLFARGDYDCVLAH